MIRIYALVIAAIVVATSAYAANPSEPPDFFSSQPANIQITISPDSARSLRVHRRKDVPINIVAFGKKWQDIPAHLKGSGTFQTIDEKPSLTLTFGNSKIHFNNSSDDPSTVNEFVGAYIFNAAGIPAPKVGHGVVTLNGKRLGLYVIKEGFASPSVDAPATEVTNWEGLHRVVDVNSFCSFVALEVMICHWDGYSLRENNFHVSRQSQDGLLLFQPAGMDQLFGKPDFTWQPDMTGRLARSMMALPEGRALYEKQFRKLFATVFDPKTLRGLIDKRVDEISPILQKTEAQRLRAEASLLGDRISKRYDYLHMELKKADNEGVAAAGGRKNAGF